MRRAALLGAAGLRLFLAIAETGSLSAAARQLGVTQPTASRRLADVEALLGDVLFARSVDGPTKRRSWGSATLAEPSLREQRQTLFWRPG
jgi:molybdate transport repressor ModE-like protein